MKTLINPDIDRSGWGSGPWDAEPDKVVWTDEETGLPCLITRNPHEGSLCGYAAVEPGHPLHGVAAADVSLPGPEVDFSDSCREGEFPEWAPVVCHVPEPGRPADVWWFGFHCAHAWDLQPGMRATRAYAGLSDRIEESQQYRDLTYVKGCVKALCEVLALCAEDPKILEVVTWR